MLPSPPRLTEDIMNDTKSDKEYAYPDVEDFNMGDHGDENDTNDEDDIT